MLYGVDDFDGIDGDHDGNANTYTCGKAALEKD